MQNPDVARTLMQFLLTILMLVGVVFSMLVVNPFPYYRKKLQKNAEVNAIRGYFYNQAGEAFTRFTMYYCLVGFSYGLMLVIFAQRLKPETLPLEQEGMIAIGIVVALFQLILHVLEGLKADGHKMLWDISQFPLIAAKIQYESGRGVFNFPRWCLAIAAVIVLSSRLYYLFNQLSALAG